MGAADGGDGWVEDCSHRDAFGIRLAGLVLSGIKPDNAGR